MILTFSSTCLLCFFCVSSLCSRVLSHFHGSCKRETGVGCGVSVFLLSLIAPIESNEHRAQRVGFASNTSQLLLTPLTACTVHCTGDTALPLGDWICFFFLSCSCRAYICTVVLWRLAVGELRDFVSLAPHSTPSKKLSPKLDNLTRVSN